MSFCLHVLYHSTMSPCQGLCAISTDTNTSWPPKYIWCHKAVQYFKNILSCCSGFQWFAEEDAFLNWPPHQELCQGRPCLLTHPAVTYRIHWLACEAVTVSKHFLPCHWCVVKQCCLMKALSIVFMAFSPSIVPAISAAAGRMKSSTIVWGLPVLATQ